MVILLVMFLCYCVVCIFCVGFWFINLLFKFVFVCIVDGGGDRIYIVLKNVDVGEKRFLWNCLIWGFCSWSMVSEGCFLGD